MKKNKRRHGAQPEMKSLFKGVWGWCPNKQPGGFRVSGNLPVKPSVYRKALLANYLSVYLPTSAVVTFLVIFRPSYC